MDGGDTAAWFASNDGSVDLTNDSELPVIDSMDCGANEEFMELSGLGGGGVGDFRGDGDAGRDVDGRSPGFGDTGRTYGSGFGSGFTADVEADGP